MSPAVEDFLYQSSSTQPSNFQNPNPSGLKFSTGSGIFNNNCTSFNSNRLDFDCSNDAATMAAVRPSRKKHVKLKKHLNNGSVITKPANCTVNGVDFVFNASNSGSVLNSSLHATTNSGNGEKESHSELLDSNMLRFSMGATDNSKLGNKLGSEQVHDSGNKSQSGDLNENGVTLNVSETGDNKFGKLSGVDFVFGVKMSNGVMNLNASKLNNGCELATEIGGTMGRSGVDGFVKVNKFMNEVESHFVDSFSNLNLGTRGPGEVNSMDDNLKKEENNNFNSGKPNNVDFVFSANCSDIRSDLHHQKDEKIGKLASDNTTEDLEKKIGKLASDNANRSVDNGTMFSNSKVNQVFHIGSKTENASSFKGRRKLGNEMTNLKSEGAKQDNTKDSFRDGCSHFVFKSNSDNDSGDNAQSKVSADSKTTNIHDSTKVSTKNKIDHTDGNECSNSNNVFVFGSDKTNISCGEKGKSDQPKTEAKSNKETVSSSSSSSTTGLGFVPKVDYCNAPLTNGTGITNSFSFSSKVGEFEDSFTGFNTPDINLANSFTVDMFPVLGKKLEFSKTNSVGLKKLKKTKVKLRQQGKNCQKGGPTFLSKEDTQSIFEEPFGCSPMDVSPCGVAKCEPTATDPATSQILKNEDDVGTTEIFGANGFSSSSFTSFADGNVSARQRPNQKKYKMKTGCGSESINHKSRFNVSYEHANGEHAEVSNQDTCEKWRKRGNQAYKNGNLSEAEVCYTKGISSIPHTETPGFCLESLLLCYSNRAAARMALGRLREGLKDCRMAASLDPNFVKANLRSANCHLLLGELEDARYHYNKCLESMLILDRRIAIEAADGLQNAQKVAEYSKLASDLIAQKTFESSTNALGIIIDALSISCYSENLLKMKGDALLMLGKHKEVVQLCEQTLDLAEKNFENKGLIKLWRWNLLSKTHFYLGRLEIALDYIEKHEQLKPTADKGSIGSEESLLAHLAITIRELLHCKKAGNEAFQSGKHTEAVEHYTNAISKSIESLPFAAVCFCNRAAAHQSLGEIIDAIGDCSTAIALDGSYSKALSRRATLWEMIRDYKHATDDLQRLITILEVQSAQNSQKSATPGTTNSSVKDLRKARRRISSLEEKAKKERSLDFYLILGIKPSDAAAEVKKAYRKAALRHHPDKAGQVIARAESGSNGQQWKSITESIQMDADSLFKMIGEAYAVLSDSTKRSKYDLEEEMWDDTNINVCSSSSRRSSDFYSSPFETSNRRNSHDTRKSYSNSYYHYWEDSRKTYHGSYPRW